MIKCGIISPMFEQNLTSISSSSCENLEHYIASTLEAGSMVGDAGPAVLPSFSEMLVHGYNITSSPGRMLWDIAQKAEVSFSKWSLSTLAVSWLRLWCQNLSARSLRRLPAIGLTRYTNCEPCCMDDALAGLMMAVETETCRSTSADGGSGDTSFL